MIRFLKELYFTGYALGYKFNIAGGWGRLNRRFGVIMDQGKGVFLVSIILFFIFEGIKSYTEVFIGKKFALDDSLWELLAVLAIYYLNLYILITRGYGIKFEHEFDKLAKSRKIVLIFSFVALLLASIILTIFSHSAYQHFFHTES